MSLTIKMYCLNMQQTNTWTLNLLKSKDLDLKIKSTKVRKVKQEFHHQELEN